jgi:hypothetical protein
MDGGAWELPRNVHQSCMRECECACACECACVNVSVHVRVHVSVRVLGGKDDKEKGFGVFVGGDW